MGSVMGLFGKDVADKFLFVLTFADVGESKIIPYLQASFGDIINQIHGPWKL